MKVKIDMKKAAATLAKLTMYEIWTDEKTTGSMPATDTIGDNPPRPYGECAEDIRAFRRGACGPEFQKFFRSRRRGAYGIREVTA